MSAKTTKVFDHAKAAQRLAHDAVHAENVADFIQLAVDAKAELGEAGRELETIRSEADRAPLSVYLGSIEDSVLTTIAAIMDKVNTAIGNKWANIGLPKPEPEATPVPTKKKPNKKAA